MGNSISEEEMDTSSQLFCEDRSRYAIITPAGVIRFGIVPCINDQGCEVLRIACLNEADASAKIKSKWGTAGESFEGTLPESCSIESNNVGLWFHIELSDPYYGYPMYYVWDTQASESISANIREIETRFVQNMV